MAAKTPEGWYDISVPLKQGMNYFPTDPAPPKIYRYHDVELGARVTMSMLEIISHTGTHIDTPLHFIPGGSTVTDMPLDAGDFRLLDRKVVAALRSLREENRYLRGLVSWAGFPQAGVPYRRDRRYAGENSESVSPHGTSLIAGLRPALLVT